jgi:flagellar biosynthetic protein FlhB
VEDDAEKEHEPSPKKLEDARKRGDLVRSADLTTAAGYAGFIIAAFALGPVAFTAFGSRAMTLIDQSDSLSLLLPADDATVLTGILIALIGSVLGFFVLPGVLALVMLLAQRALVFAPEKLEIKLSRIDPLANAGQKFGASGLVEFFKSMAKLILVSVLLGWFLWSRLPRILMTVQLEPALVSRELCLLLTEFLVLVFGIALAVGLPDYIWQRFEHLRRNRMSRQELMDEFKQSDGDPHMKQQRRQRGYDIATNRMLADVAKSDVVIVNPTHYAVALKWRRRSGQAPVCLAKGVDEIAARIREAAMMAGVPLHSDPPSARALYGTVGIGEEIRPDHYKAVAAAIRFAERMRQRARMRSGG